MDLLRAIGSYSRHSSGSAWRARPTPSALPPVRKALRGLFYLWCRLLLTWCRYWRRLLEWLRW